jgi:hypothetical protein
VGLAWPFFLLNDQGHLIAMAANNKKSCQHVAKAIKMSIFNYTLISTGGSPKSSKYIAKKLDAPKYGGEKLQSTGKTVIF